MPVDGGREANGGGEARRLAEQRVGESGGARQFGQPWRRAALQGASRPARTLARCAGRLGGMARAGLGRCQAGEKGGKNGS
jgi:hypothetical protein